MANNLQVKVTADIVDAQAKLALLNAEFRNTQRELNVLARAGAAGSLDAAGAQQLQQLTARTLELEAAARPLAVTVGDAGFAVRGLGAAAAAAGQGVASYAHHNATAVRYTRELFDEISSGRTRYLPSTLAALAQQTLGMSGAMLAAVGAAAALAAGLGYLAYRALEDRAAIQNLNIAARDTGNFDLSAAAIQRFVNIASSAANVTEKDAQTIGGALVSIPNLARPTFEALSHLMSAWELQTGQSAKEIAKDWRKTFSGSAEAAAEAAHLSQAQIDAARAADLSGNAYKIQASQLNTLVAVYQRAADEIAQKSTTLHTGSFLEDVKNLGSYLYGGNDVYKGGRVTTETAQQRLLAQNTAALRTNIAAIKERISALQQMETTPEQRLEKGMDLVKKINPEIEQVRKLRSEIKELEDARGAAKTPGQIEAIDQAIQKLSASLQKLQGGKKIDLTDALSGLSGRVGEELAQHQERIAEELPAAMQRSQDEQLAIERQSLASEQQILSERVQYAENALNAEVQAGKVSAEQRASVERALTVALYAEDEKRLEASRQSYEGQPAEYARVTNQIAELKIKEALALQRADDSVIVHVRQSTKEQLSTWQRMTKEIESTEGNMVNNILYGRRTLSQSMAALGAELVAKEIQQDAQAVTTRLLLYRQADAQKKALQQGGVLYHALIEAQKTVQTTAGEQARTAATVSANATRTAATASAAAAQKGISAAAGAATVQSDAAKAFAGTYASVAQIPYVGWIMAPIAASAAYAGVMAYEGLASLDVGTFNVPQDMVAQIHRGEMVVPRTFAEGLRSAVSGPGASGETHYHHHGDINVADSDVLEALDSPGGRDRLIGMVGEALNRGARP